MNRKIVLHLALVLSFLLVSASLALAAQPQAITGLDPSNLAPWFVNYIEGGTDSSVGADPSIGVRYTGITYITYYDVMNGDLRMAYYVGDGGNCGDGNQWSCSTIDSAGNVGRYSSLAFTASSVIIGGTYYGISYYDSTNEALKYAHYNCTPTFPITCGWIIETIQESLINGTSYGTYTVLKYTADDTPIIAYHYSSALGNDSLKYAYYVGSGGNCGVGDSEDKWMCETIDSGDGIGQYISMDMDLNEVPRFTYYDSANNYLKYSWYQGLGSGGCTNSTDSGWSCIVIDTQGGKYSAYNFQDASPNDEEVAYYDPVSGKLLYAYYVGYGDPIGNCGLRDLQWTWRCEEMMDMGMNLLQGDVALTLDGDSYPLIAYMEAAEDQAPSRLNIIRPAAAVGQIIGNCGPPPPGGLFQDWWCQTLDNGDAYLDEAYTLSAATNPLNGLVSIAYYEDDEYYLDANLKIAQQFFITYLPVITR